MNSQLECATGMRTTSGNTNSVRKTVAKIADIKNIFILLLLAGCSVNEPPGINAEPQRHIGVVLEIDPGYVSAYVYHEQPCGCSTRPITLGTCVETTDACSEDCDSCLETIRLEAGSDSYYFEKYSGMDWSGGMEHSLSLGEKGHLVIEGCGIERTLEFVTPSNRTFNSQIPLEPNENLHFSWDGFGADSVFLGASHGYGSKLCLTEDDGEEDVDFILSGYLQAWIKKLYSQHREENSGWNIQVFEVGRSR